MLTLGVIGTGHLATYLVAGLRRGGFTGRVVVTPRNADRAAALARDAQCEIAASAQEVLEAADVVLLSVRPAQAPEALAGLTWSPRHTALSAMAGISLDAVRQLVPGAGRVHLIMPLSYLATVRGPIPLHPPAPDRADLADLLGAAGEVLAFDEEQAYDASLLAACVAGWIYDLADVLTVELARHGLPPEAARALVLGNFAGSLGEALARPDEPLSALSAEIATPGTYTVTGLDALREQRFDEPWRAAIRAMAARLNG